MTTDIFMTSKAWPFDQARAILRRLDIEKKRGIDRGDRPVIFETGYGPSGLPHIGTFGEVVRTTMVRNAFIALTEGKIETRLICVSDDMDGMRKALSASLTIWTACGKSQVRFRTQSPSKNLCNSL